MHKLTVSLLYNLKINLPLISQVFVTINLNDDFVQNKFKNVDKVFWRHNDVTYKGTESKETIKIWNKKKDKT